eukprot:jgi/Mesvir1/10070/Mv05551-RA.1
MESWESVYVVDQFISVCDVLRVGLGVNRVVDVFEEHSSMFKRCVRHTRPNGHLDLVADAITMTCVLRALSKVSWAQRRIECAHRVVEKLGASRSIVSAVFEIPSNGRADVGAYSDLLITPLPDGVVTSEDIEHFEGWPLNYALSERMMKRTMKKYGVKDEDVKNFARDVKRLARIDEKGNILGTCSPGWEFVQVCYEAAGNFFRMHSAKYPTEQIFSWILGAFRTVQDPVHRVPETRIFDLDWAQTVDDRAHFVVSGKTKEKFRASQTNLLPEDPVRYAYTTSVADLHAYVCKVFRAANDHSFGAKDLDSILDNVEERWSAFAITFGYRQLCNRPRFRREIESVRRLEQALRATRLFNRGRMCADMESDEETDTDMETSGIGMGVS